MKIKIPTKFIEVELDKLSSKDIENLFAASDSVNTLNRYLISKNLSPQEIIRILSVNIQCNESKE